MCGICGKLNFDRHKQVSSILLREMADTIAHRGPDDDGYLTSGSVGLGFRRLSIIDLNTGHQPISNEDGSVWIVFNGEIYNYRELRHILETKGHVFTTHTDTEVIVHLYEEYGPQCVEQLRGMFAFAIWDKNEDVLFLARDRVGIKPLYYWLSDTGIVFGSEIKALLADPDVHAEIAPAMIDRFLSFYFVPGEETLLKDIRKLAPGSYMLVRNGRATITRYWNLSFAPAELDARHAVDDLYALLEECVRMHMISDVPVGFLLSGGLDSTAMMSMAVGKTEQRLSSFTLGFSASGVTDERPYARLAAARYGSDHYETSITAQDFADFMPRLLWYMEEPVCEPQAVALYYVTRLAAQFVKVLISGEGGDEAFAGYPIYRNILWLERLKRPLRPALGLLSELISRVNAIAPSHRLEKYGPLLQRQFRSYYFSRTSSPARYFNARGAELYSDDFLVHVNRNFSIEPAVRWMNDGAADSTLNQMLYVDTKTSLPDDLLLKADKMTMANSVELRVPFLDHRLLEFAASLPERFKVHGFTGKYLAKQALQRNVPVEIIRRKKVGFPVPYDAWMRNELRDWVADVLLDRTAANRGYFKRSSIEKLISDDRQFHTYPKEILSLISLELWHRSFVDSSPAQTYTSAMPPVATA